MAILDMAWRIDPNVRVFTVDTGRLPAGDLRADRPTCATTTACTIEVYYPEARRGGSHGAHSTGPNLFYKCGAAAPDLLRRPQGRARSRRALDGLDGWITGLRRDQWATRSNIRKIEIDHDHGGLIKVNPLADWTEEEVWDYVREQRRARQPALRRRATRRSAAIPAPARSTPGEDPRAGRWWWEKNAPKECGMHCAVETGGFEHELEAILHRGALHAVQR